MKKENFRITLRKEELKRKKIRDGKEVEVIEIPDGIELPWFAEKERIISGWLRAPQKVCYLGEEKGEEEGNTFTLEERGKGYFLKFPKEVKEILERVVEKAGKAIVELEFFLREEDEFEVDPTPAELRRAVLEMIEEGVPLKEVLESLLNFFAEGGVWEFEIEENGKEKLITNYFLDEYIPENSKLMKEERELKLLLDFIKMVKKHEKTPVSLVVKKGKKFDLLLAESENFTIRAKIPRYVAENRDPRLLSSYLRRLLEVYEREKEPLLREKEEFGEPLKEFLAGLRRRIQDLLSEELKLKLGTFSIIFYKLFMSPRPHYKYFFDAEQERELEKRIKNPKDPLTEGDIRELLSSEYGDKGSYSYYVVKSSVSSYVPDFRKRGILKERISEIEGRLFLMDEELDTFQIGIPVFLKEHEWPTFIIWILGTPQAPALSPVTVAKVKQLVYSVIPAFKMAYELYVKTAELEALKGQQSADYFIVHNLPKVITHPLLNLADYLESGKLDSSTAAEIIRSYANLGEALIAEFAAIEGGEEKVEISLKKVLEEVSKRVEASLKIQDLVKEELFNVTPPVRTFPRLIEDFKIKVYENAFKNALFVLLENAYKYGATSVSVSVKKEKGYVKISLKDNGEGIEEELLAKIKERLREIAKRGEEAFKLNLSKRIRGTDSKGMGVGLQLVQRLLLRHKVGDKRGYLEIDSEGKGKGTTVTLNIPVEE